MCALVCAIANNYPYTQGGRLTGARGFACPWFLGGAAAVQHGLASVASAPASGDGQSRAAAFGRDGGEGGGGGSFDRGG